MHSNYTDKKVKETKNCVFFSRKPTMQKCFIMPPDARLSAIHSQNYTFYKVLLICLVYYFLAIILFSDHCLPCNGRLRVPGVGQRALELDTGAALGEHSQWPLHAETGHWGHDVNMMWQCDNVTMWQVTQHSQLHEHAELLTHADLTLVSPAVSRPHGAEKDNVRIFLFLSLRSYKTILVKIIKSQQNSPKYCFAQFCLNFLPMPHKTCKQLLLWRNYIYSYSNNIYCLWNFW